MLPLHDPNAARLLLQQIIYLWITCVILVILVDHKIPQRRLHNIANITLALLSIFELIAIVYVSIRYVF